MDTTNIVKKRKSKQWPFKTAGLALPSILIATTLVACASPLKFESSVQLIVSDNTSTLADQSFSESSYNGIKNYFEQTKKIPNIPNANSNLIQENNGVWKRPGTDTISRIASYQYAFSDGANVVVATGFNQQIALQQVTSTKPEFGRLKESFLDKGFIFIDGGLDGFSEPGSTEYDSDPYNVSSLSFRADDGSFLAGIAAAVFLNKYQNFFAFNGRLGVSGFVGLAFGSTLNYLNGFRLGIHYWNAILQPLIKYVDANKTIMTKKVDWVTSNNNRDDFRLANFISGNFNANNESVSTLVQGMRRNGANVIFPIAGPQTSLVVREIGSSTQANFAKSIVLGVDTAQEVQNSLRNPLPGGEEVGEGDVKGQIIQFSSIKNLALGVQGIIEAITEGKNNKDATPTAKGYLGFGFNNIGTISNAGVGVSEAGLRYVIDPFFWTDVMVPTSGMPNMMHKLNKVNQNDWYLDNFIANHSIKALVQQDPIVTKYNMLLASELKTLNPQNTNGQNSQNLWTFDANDNGLNGPLNNGEWKIFNNLADRGLNNFLSIKLSNQLPGINDDNDASFYSVPSPVAQYIAQPASSGKLNFTIDDMFFRIN